ncbi:putative mannosyltransferase ktr4 [Lithohypha guttulata]|nr:putative mannosyltransferase ktr4 [Lithohypha guttulata]
MGVARPIRFLGAVCILLVFVLISLTQFYRTTPVGLPTTVNSGSNVNSGGKVTHWDKDPLLDPVEEPPQPLWRHTDHDYSPDSANSARLNATLLVLVRNEELNDLIPSMRELEATWNHKFNYPWTFFNDVPFTEEFKRKTTAATKAKTNYHVIPDEHWNMPEWISNDLYEESAKILNENGVQYSGKISYNKMCRWNSGLFYKHPALQDVQYYWRVEPKVKFFCDVDYDVFRYMQDHNKTYGFNINLFDAPDSIPSLWPETIKFLAAHPEHLAKNNAMAWLVDNERRPDVNLKAHGYSTCHFWTNFEIADMSFWRSQAYEDYFNHLDRAGGFFYERWGDAPVHAIALGLFLDSSRIHWFKDIGYNHVPFFNCPNSPKCRGCTPGQFYAGESWLQRDDCRPLWFKYVGMG